LKEQDAAGGEVAELSAPPYEDKFLHKIEIQSKDDSESVSEGRVRRTFWPIKYWEPCIWGYIHRLRDFLFFQRVLYRLPCRQLRDKKIQLVLGFTLCLRDWTRTTLACNRGFMETFH
jgi:hypothetical protein